MIDGTADLKVFEQGTEPAEASPEEAGSAEVPVPEEYFAEQVEKDGKKQDTPPLAGQCGPLEDGPGAEPPVECEPPSSDSETIKHRPKDEL